MKRGKLVLCAIIGLAIGASIPVWQPPTVAGPPPSSITIQTWQFKYIAVKSPVAQESRLVVSGAGVLHAVVNNWGVGTISDGPAKDGKIIVLICPYPQGPQKLELNISFQNGLYFNAFEIPQDGSLTGFAQGMALAVAQSMPAGMTLLYQPR